MQYRGNHKQNKTKKDNPHKKRKKKTKRENMCKWWTWQGSGLQNLQTAHAEYYDQNKQLNQKKKKKRAK